MKSLSPWIHGIMILVLGLAPSAFADEDEVSKLKDQIQKLNRRVSQLEDQLREQPPRAIVPAQGRTPSGNVIESAMSGIKLSGYVDTAWNWNGNNPGNPPAGNTDIDGDGILDPNFGTRDNSLRVFDTNEGSFTVHAVEVVLEKPAPTDTGGVGFRTDFFYGKDAEVITAGGSTLDDFDLQQAYVEARLPLKFLEGSSIFSDTIYFRGGKYVTLAGAEVIEAKDNWNTSRSIGFGFAIPFTHTGVRAVYDLWGGKVTLTAGLNNGWDLNVDNNNFGTLEAQIAWKPVEDLLFTATTYYGPENPNQDGHKRVLYDFVALWHVTDKLSLMANFDFGNQRRVFSNNGGIDFENSQWHAYALYGRYQLTDKLAMATRWEVFVDNNNFRVGPGAVAPAVDYLGGLSVFTFPNREKRYWEWTYTTEYKLYDNLIARGEYRYDWSEAPIFNGESSQQTLSAQLIYSFA